MSGRAGGEIDRVEVSLRVAGDALDPDRITRMLGVPASFAARKGELVERGGARVAQGTGSWTYTLPSSSEWELGDAIETLLERLPADPALWETLAGELETEVVCGLFLSDVTRGTTLRVETMALLAERRLKLGLEIHGRQP